MGPMNSTVAVVQRQVEALEMAASIAAHISRPRIYEWFGDGPMAVARSICYGGAKNF